MNIAVAADPGAIELKDAIKEHLESKGHTVLDAGSTRDNEVVYHAAAAAAAKLLQEKTVERAVLFCGTGAGVSIVANKFSGVCAVCVESVFSARMARVANDANAISMGAMIVAPAMAKEMVDAWLGAQVAQGLEEWADYIHDALKKVAEIDTAQRRA